jgi:predicted molibdopterin-dependent oxidoreductase YjgC
MELIMANHHGDCLTCAKDQQCELQTIARYLGIEQEHFDRLRKSTRVLPIDTSHPAFDRDPNKCILCAKCVRACHEIACVGAIDLAFRGYDAKVSTFGDKPILESICQSCGECIEHWESAATKSSVYGETRKALLIREAFVSRDALVLTSPNIPTG